MIKVYSFVLSYFPEDHSIFIYLIDVQMIGCTNSKEVFTLNFHDLGDVSIVLYSCWDQLII